MPGPGPSPAGGSGAGPSVSAAIRLAVLVAAVLGLYQIVLPVLADEAYLLSWGLDPAAGYYDHPPLTGWVSTGLLWLDAALGLGRPVALARGFALGVGALSAGLLYRRLVLLAGPDLARGLLAVWLLIPATTLFFSVYLNDLLVMALSLVFVLACHDLWRRPGPAPGPLLLAAVALGLMLLTKYSAALVYLGLVAGLIWNRRGRRFLLLRLGPVTLLAGLPFLWHLGWNARNCAVNFAFNFAFRQERASGGPVAVWLASMVLSTGSIAFQGLWGFVRSCTRGPDGAGPDGAGPDGAGSGRFFAPVFLASIALALLIALTRGNFGGNWAAPFGALAVLSLGEARAARGVRAARASGLALTLGLVLPLLLLSAALKAGLLPAARAPLPGEAAVLRLTLPRDLGSGALVPALREAGRGRVYATAHYASTAMLRLQGLGPAVTLSASVYGRNDDLFVDYAALDGRDFLILAFRGARERNQARELARRFFATWRELEPSGPRGRYLAILADGFDYPAFRAEILAPFIRDHYLAAPVPFRACPPARYLSGP